MAKDQKPKKVPDTGKGYHGSSDSQEPRNYNTDPGQASVEQQQRQERGQPINDGTKTK